MPAAYRCEHPECNGRHGHSCKSEMCPAAYERLLEDSRERRKRPESRERERERGRERRKDPEYRAETRERDFQRDNFDPRRRISQLHNRRKRQLSGS